MNSVTQHYIIDFSSNNNFVQVPAMQGDGNDTRYIEIEMIENGRQYTVDPDDTYITIAGTNPDGTEVWNNCELTDEGYLLVKITYQMTTVPGRSDYQIVLFSDKQNNQIKSFPFILLVTPATFDPSYIMSENEFEALAQFTTAAQEAAEAAAQSAADAELAGTIGIMNIRSVDGHLIFEKNDHWRGSFKIVDGKNLEVTWE